MLDNATARRTMGPFAPSVRPITHPIDARARRPVRRGRRERLGPSGGSGGGGGSLLVTLPAERQRRGKERRKKNKASLAFCEKSSGSDPLWKKIPLEVRVSRLKKCRPRWSRPATAASRTASTRMSSRGGREAFWLENYYDNKHWTLLGVINVSYAWHAPLKFWGQEYFPCDKHYICTLNCFLS